MIEKNKLASLGEMAAGIAHEVNNPLGFISSNLEVLQDYFSLFHSAFSYIDSKALASFEQLKELINTMNDIYMEV